MSSKKFAVFLSFINWNLNQSNSKTQHNVLCIPTLFKNGDSKLLFANIRRYFALFVFSIRRYVKKVFRLDDTRILQKNGHKGTCTCSKKMKSIQTIYRILISTF